MNMFKKKDGFTLVELIVVIAILAILAGVAVPAYTGYLERAEEAADMQVLAAVHTAASAALAQDGETVDSITVTGGTATIEPEPSDDDAFDTYFTGNTIPSDLVASWEDGEWTIS